MDGWRQRAQNQLEVQGPAADLINDANPWADKGEKRAAQERNDQRGEAISQILDDPEKAIQDYEQSINNNFRNGHYGRGTTRLLWDFGTIFIGGGAGAGVKAGARGGASSAGARFGDDAASTAFRSKAGRPAPLDAGPVSVMQLKSALGRAGMSVRKYDIVHTPRIQGSGGDPAYGRSASIGGQPMVGPRGRPLIEISDLGLSSLRQGVVTVYHEIYHIQSVIRRGGYPGPERAAERYGLQMLDRFIARSGS